MYKLILILVLILIVILIVNNFNKCDKVENFLIPKINNT